MGVSQIKFRTLRVGNAVQYAQRASYLGHRVHFLGHERKSDRYQRRLMLLLLPLEIAIALPRFLDTATHSRDT